MQFENPTHSRSYEKTVRLESALVRPRSRSSYLGEWAVYEYLSGVVTRRTSALSKRDGFFTASSVGWGFQTAPVPKLAATL
jgi:hypothetical protein